MTEHAVSAPGAARTEVLGSRRRAVVGSWLRSQPAWLWLGAIVVVSSVVRGLLAVAAPAPWIIPDELIYTELARGLAETGGFELRGSAFAAWSFGPLYAAVIAPFFVVLPDVEAYTAVKAANSLLFSLAAVPAYALARPILSRRGAILAAALAVSVPSSVYTTKIMSENVSYPILLAALAAIVAAVERPTTRRQVIALGVIGIAILARAQMVVLLPAFLSSAVAYSWLERPAGDAWLRRTVRSYWVTVSFVVAAAASGLVVLLAGGGKDAVLGIKAVALERIELAEVPTWFVFHVAELSLYVAVIPLVAAAAVAVSAFRRGASPRLRAFFVVASAFAFWLLVLVATYASQPKPFPRIYDRYVFYLAPLLLICVIAWAEAGLARPRRLVIGAAVVAAGLPAMLPYDGLLNGREWGVSSSTVGLVVWYGPRVVLDQWFVPVLLLFTSLLALRAVRATNGRALLLPVVLTMFGTALVAHSKSHWLGGQLREHAAPANAHWVDDVARDGSVVTLWPGHVADASSLAYFVFVQHEFFNGSIDGALHVSAPLKRDLPSTEVVSRGTTLVRRETGRPVTAEYVLTNTRLPLAATIVGRDAGTGMALYRVDGPVRLRAPLGR